MFRAPTFALESVHFSAHTVPPSICRQQSAELVFSGAIPVEELISNRVPLGEIR